jgi:hypothetical protein
MSRLATRVARLEHHLRMGESSQAVVCWIGPDGVPEDLPDNLTGPVRVIYLPRKSASPEAWMRECALRRQQQSEDEPPYAPSL